MRTRTPARAQSGEGGIDGPGSYRIHSVSISIRSWPPATDRVDSLMAIWRRHYKRTSANRYTDTGAGECVIGGRAMPAAA
jgi:hypothetical protein